MTRTCEAIVKATIGMDVEERVQIDTWIGDTEAAEGKGRVETARAIWAYALSVFSDKQGLWEKAADLEKGHSTRYDTLYHDPARPWIHHDRDVHIPDRELRDQDAHTRAIQTSRHEGVVHFGRY